MRRDESVRCRNVGCSKLARCNALRGEEQATFEEVSHTYTIGGVVAQQSTTDLVAQVFEKFDAYATVSTYYNTWKTKKDIRYWDIIQSHVRDDGSIDDEKAMQTIIQNWTETGALATRLGTELHLYVERLLNSEECLAPPQCINQEAKQFDEFLLSRFIEEHDLSVFRTELIVWFKIDDILVAAGQIDAVFKGSEGYYLFDWKRVHPKKDVSQAARAFQDRNGIGPARCIPDTTHHRYSLQLSLYAKMLLMSYGLNVEDRMYLLRMHCNLNTAELVHCTDLRDVADEILHAEYRSILNRD